MKSKKLQVLFWIVVLLCIGQTSLAADFSRAKRTFVPPSLIHRDLDALGTDKWNLPAANTGMDNVNPIDSLLSKYGGNTSQMGHTDGLANPEYIHSVNRIIARVNTLLANGKVAEAENLTRDGLKLFPASSVLKNKFTSITTSEAQTFLAAGYPDLAGTKAREAIACNPNTKAAKVVEGKVLQARGLNPYSAEGHTQAGDSLSADGRLLEAGVEYKLGLHIKPTAAGQIGLGNLALGKGSIIEADRHYEQAIALDPKSSAAYRQRGALKYVMQDVVGANSDFGKAVALNPNDQLATEALIGLWKQQVANNPGVNSHLGLARAYMQTDNLEAARSEYKTVVSLDPNNPALPEARHSFKIALAKQQAKNQQQNSSNYSLPAPQRQIMPTTTIQVNPIQTNPSNPINNTSPPDLFPAPLKAPIPTKSEIPASNSNNTAVYANNYLRTGDNAFMQPHLFIDNNQYAQNFSVIDSNDEVATLANFLCSVRTLMLAEQQALQLSNAGYLK